MKGEFQVGFLFVDIDVVFDKQKRFWIISKTLP
jgi:hypothetical protein